MFAKTWTVVAPDGPHVIEFRHGRWLSGRTIVVDGRTVPTCSDQRRISETIVETFPVGDATGVLTIEPRGFTGWHHALTVGEVEVVPRLPKLPMPAWVWLPAAASFVPFLALAAQQGPALGVAVSGLMGGGGAVACFALARDPSVSPAARQWRCFGLATLVWAVQLLPALAMAALFAAMHRVG